MIKIETNIHIPDRWDELTQPQAIETVLLLEGYFKGEYNLTEFRLKLLKKLTGYHPDKKKYNPEAWDQITFNLFTLSELLTFPLKPLYHNPELLEVLPEALQTKLQTTLPCDISDPNELQQMQTITSLLKWEAQINLHICKNIMPDINGIPGTVFDIDEHGVVTTDMIAAEYVDAYEFFNLYRQTRAVKYLDAFISSLYRRNRGCYSTYLTQKNAALFTNVPVHVKNVAYLWFQSFLEYLYERSQFTWLFNRTKSTEESFSMGMGASIYQLASAGYGTKTEVELYPLQDYLSIQLKELTDAIKSMKDMDMKMNEIEKKTGLSADIIAQI